MQNETFSITGGGENLTAAQALTLAQIDANRTGRVQHITNSRGGSQAVYPKQRGIASRD